MESSVVDRAERHRQANRDWAYRKRHGLPMKRLCKGAKPIQVKRVKTGHCPRCDTLLTLEPGNGEVCDWCLNDLGII